MVLVSNNVWPFSSFMFDIYKDFVHALNLDELFHFYCLFTYFWIATSCIPKFLTHGSTWPALFDVLRRGVYNVDKLTTMRKLNDQHLHFISKGNLSWSRKKYAKKFHTSL